MDIDLVTWFDVAGGFQSVPAVAAGRIWTVHTNHFHCFVILYGFDNVVLVTVSRFQVSDGYYLSLIGTKALALGNAFTRE